MKKVSHAVCNNHFNQVPLTANILNKHVKIHVYTNLSWILSHLSHLEFVYVLTHSDRALEVKPTNKDIGIRRV